MKRKIEEKHVEKIKKMLSKNFKVTSIRDIMECNYGVLVTKAQIQSIKKRNLNVPVKQEWNNTIRKTNQSN